jgi:hypothetical protein
MKAFFKNIDYSDVLILLGCILVGYGLFLLKNPGIFAVTIGVIVLNFGVLRSILGKNKK